MRLLLLIFSLFCISISAQDYPKEDFINPLEFRNYLAGNFAELRGFHFHSGIDIKTKQSEGHNVKAIADGWVSRINVSPRGYGHAVYITHDNGYVSVYAHLSEYKGLIDQYMRIEQYKHEKFALDVTVPKNEIQVKKGEIIGLSGNSGSSGGPHLHFEIRDAKTQEILNPFLFGFNIPDSSAPFINGLYVYSENGDVAGKSRYDLSGGNHFKSPIHASGDVFFGVKTYDRHDGADNWNGVYKIETWVNDELTFTYQADRFSFEESRFINCFTDYHQYMTNKGWIYKLFRAPGNSLQMIDAKNNGFVKMEPGKEYQIKMKISDYAGNSTNASFKLIGKENTKSPKQLSGEIIYWNKENYISNNDVELWLPKNSVYEDMEFNFKKEEGKFYLMSDKIPLHKFYTLAIKTADVPAHQMDKAVIAVKYNYGGKWTTDYFSTEHKNGKLLADVRDFGIFVVEVDDKNPTIQSINVKENATFTSAQGVMKFTIKDSQSGINKHDAFINGKWVLTAYDKKNDRLTLDLNKEEIANGSHTLELKVTDGKNNTATYTVNFKKSS